MSPGTVQKRRKATPEQRRRWNAKYHASTKGRETKRRVDARWFNRHREQENARVRAQKDTNRARGICVMCWDRKAMKDCWRCRECQTRCNRISALKRQTGMTLKQWREADRIAEMRELSELALMGSLRFTALDLARKAA